jgi:hypothetical protein
MLLGYSDLAMVLRLEGRPEPIWIRMTAMTTGSTAISPSAQIMTTKDLTVRDETFLHRVHTVHQFQ